MSPSGPSIEAEVVVLRSWEEASRLKSKSILEKVIDKSAVIMGDRLGLDP
jgi:hypothetical protein